LNLTNISPFFIVTDIEDSVAFYVDMLGFELQYLGPEDNPFFAIVGRDQIFIMLKVIAEDIRPIPNHKRHEQARWDAFIGTQDPDLLFEEYRLKGLQFRQPIQNDGDGLRGFELSDADGYVLFFGRPDAQ
jgi:catechol 2,3-dioxygenase-like lactoylglutathione lyase family enzyme